MDLKRTVAIVLALLGLVLCQDARAFYNPSTGRWLSRDLIGERGCENLHAFVRNDALQHVDRKGEDIWGAFPVAHLPARPVIPNASPRSSAQETSPKRSGDPTGIDKCNRPIENPENDPIIGCANLRGHDFFRWPDGHGGYEGVGQQNPQAEDGTLPQPDYPERARACVHCYRTGRALGYGSGKGKSGRDASEDEIKDCIKNRPQKGKYGGLCNNCNDWARGAAKDCGLDCTGEIFVPKPAKN